MSFHRNTTASVVLSASSLGLSAYHFFLHPEFDFRLVASILSISAFGAAFSEFKKYSSLFQILGIGLAMITLGISLDHYLPYPPYVTTALMLSFFTYRKFFRKWFSESDMIWLDMFCVLASVGCLVFGNLHYEGSWKSWVFPSIPIVLNGFFAFSDFMYTRMQLGYLAGKKRQVDVGVAAPDFSLPDKEGKKVNLSDFRDKHHVLLVFIRNDWCPSCRIKLRTYEQHRHKFNEKNIQLLTISPGGDSDKDINTTLGISFNILYDEGQLVCKTYGVQLPVNVVGEKNAPGMPLPASFLVDKTGVVRYTSRPDRIGEFLDPMTIFPALEALK